MNALTIFHLVILVLLSPHVYADWFCREASSQRLSERLYHACGIGTGTEPEARKKSLEAALEEFNEICKSASSCRGKEIELLPKRTDCNQNQDGSFTCFRMIEVLILKHDKKAIDIDESELDAEISRKREELESLHSKFSKLAHLRRLEERTKELKELEQRAEEAEVGLVNLESKLSNADDYMAHASSWSASLYLIYFKGPIEGHAEGQYGLGFERRRRLADWLSVGGGLSYISDFGKKEIESNGPASGTSDFPQSSNGWLVNVDLGFEFNKFKVGPMFSHYSYSKEVVTASYSSLGIKTGEQATSVSGSHNGYGLKISYDFNTPVVDLFATQYPDKPLSMGISVGISF